MAGNLLDYKMEQSFSERFLFWVCDTFGHAKSGSSNTEWTYNGFRHYQCTRCTRTVSIKI